MMKGPHKGEPYVHVLFSYSPGMMKGPYKGEPYLGFLLEQDGDADSFASADSDSQGREGSVRV